MKNKTLRDIAIAFGVALLLVGSLVYIVLTVK